MAEVQARDLSKDEHERLRSTFERDLIAFYKQLEEEMIRLLIEAEREGWTPEELMLRVDALLSDTEERTVGGVEKSVVDTLRGVEDFMRRLNKRVGGI